MSSPECTNLTQLMSDRDWWFWWLTASTSAIAVGVLLELPEFAYELMDILRRRVQRLKYRIVLLEKYSEIAKIIAFVGWFLIAGGLVAERIAEAKVNDADATIQGCNTHRLTTTEARLEAATEQLTRLKTPRSLDHRSELVEALKPFKGTEYVFVSVFEDEESINLLKAIDNVLHEAGWKRGKSVAGFPSISVYGPQQPDFFVPVGLNTGVQVSTESPKPIDLTRPVNTLPRYLQATGTLEIDLRACISPPHDNNVGAVAQVNNGKSKIVRIAVGKKP